MAETQAPPVRPDIDIHEEIGGIILRYPPLSAERRHFTVSVKQGVVVLAGYLDSSITYNYLLGAVRGVAGVRAVDDGRLFLSETLRRTVGRLLPEGVTASIRYGVVILSGSSAADELNEAAQRVANLPGVEKVLVG